MPNRNAPRTRRLRRKLRLGTALILCLAALPRLSTAVDPVALRASYVLSLSKFVTWPSGAAPDAGHFNICIQGDEIVNVFFEQLRDKQAGGRKVAVSPLSSHPGGSDCQVLYVHGSELWRIGTILSEIAGRPILTIGDGEPFIRAGGMIELKPEGGRLVFEINLATAERTGLKLSSQILELANQIVR